MVPFPVTPHQKYSLFWVLWIESCINGSLKFFFLSSLLIACKRRKCQCLHFQILDWLSWLYVSDLGGQEFAVVWVSHYNMFCFTEIVSLDLSTKKSLPATTPTTQPWKWPKKFTWKSRPLYLQVEDLHSYGNRINKCSDIVLVNIFWYRYSDYLQQC